MPDSVLECTKCPLHKELPYGCRPIEGHGNHNADILVVSDFPTRTGVRSMEIISGRVEKYFTKVLIKVGIDPDKIYTTSLLHCTPLNKGKERQPYKNEIEKCKTWVWQDIKHISPKAIITLGLSPTQVLGSPIFEKNIKLIDVVGKKYELPYTSAHLFPCYHPKFILTRGSDMEKEFISTLSLVKDFVSGPGLSD